MTLRPELEPRKPSSAQIEELALVINALVDALDTGAACEDLMQQHNRISGRTDIDVLRYHQLYSSMSCEEAAEEAFTQAPRVVSDISLEELVEIARRIKAQETPPGHVSYYVQLFEMNTKSGNSDMFFWPEEDWLKELGTDEPSPTQIVERAMRDTSIKL